MYFLMLINVWHSFYIEVLECMILAVLRIQIMTEFGLYSKWETEAIAFHRNEVKFTPEWASEVSYGTHI